MPQAETFLMKVATPPGGVMVSDFSYIIDGQMRPVLLKTNAQVDLEHVEMEKYARSAAQGALASMEKGGSVVRVVTELSEKVYDSWRNAMEKFKAPRRESPYAHATQVVSIEPGLQVAVGGAPAPTQVLPTVPPPGTEPDTTGATPTPAMQAVAPEPGAQAGPQENTSVPAGTEVKSWKDGLTLTEQEKFIKESEDVEFLKRVSTDKEETKKMQRLAKARLAELE